jgi:tape measure domain-containing protein
MGSQVGVRIKVESSGLENFDRLSKELRDAGKDTAALDRQAAELAAELQRLARQQALIDQFRRLKTETQGAGEALKQAQAKAQELGREMAQTEAPTARQTAAFQKARQAVKDAGAAYQAQRVDLQALRQQMSTTGVSSDNLAAAQVRVKEQMAGTRQRAADLRAELQRQAEGWRATGTAATTAGAQQAAAASKAESAIDGLRGQLQTLRNIAGIALGGSLVGNLAREVSEVADAYSNLQARIKLVTGAGDDFNRAFEEVQQIAQRTSSALEGTGTLFARIAQAGRDLGIGLDQSLAITETINQAIQLSGGSAQSADAAITQLVQALQSGVLRGDEFNSVMEQAPRLAQALAAGLGVGTGALREMAQQGQLSAEVVIGALRDQSAAVAAEFASLPPTVGRALTNLSSQWTVYVGEVDKANGVSEAAAKAINALAGNLETLGSLLAFAGKAGAAYAALQLARHFADKAAAVRVSAGAIAAETAATAAQTAATAANTAATNANAAAKRGAATAGAAAAAATAGITAAAAPAAGAVAGLLATMFRFVSAASWIGLAVTALSLLQDTVRGVGTWLGEGAAKLMGFRDRSDEVAASLRATGSAGKDAAAGVNESAAAAKRAEAEALKLDKAAQELVKDFDELRGRGESVEAALGKVSKALKLDNLQGIASAGAALDALAVRGVASADQVRDAWRQALDGRDLGIFATQAQAAFDKSEQGARRLQAALDAVADEALRRVGTSVQELQTGFSAAMNSAINDTDALAVALKDLEATAEETSRLLAKSLSKEVEAATTEKAIKLVIERMEELGEQGLLAGDDLVAGLDKAKKKLDELLPGINSLQEALAEFGIKSRDELQRVADRAKEAWLTVRTSTQVSLADQIKAFTAFRDKAIAANNGVESSFIRQEYLILQSRAAVGGLGAELDAAMKKGGKAGREAGDEIGRGMKVAGGSMAVAKGEADRLAGSLKEVAKAGQAAGSALTWPGRNSDGSLAYTGRNRDGSLNGQTSAGGSFYTPPPDGSGDWEWKATLYRPGGEWVLSPAANQRRQMEHENAILARGGYERDQYGIPRKTGTAPVAGTPATRDTGKTLAEAEAIRNAIGQPNLVLGPDGVWRVPGQVPEPGGAAGGTAQPSRYISIDLNGAGGSATVMADEANADRLVRLLRESMRTFGQ